MTGMLALAIVFDTSVALALALLLCRALRRQSAALRHLVLAASLVVAASAPLLELTLPGLELPVLMGPAQVTSSGPTLGSEPASTTAAAAAEAGRAPRLGWIQILAVIWALGCGVLVASLLAGLARLTWMTRRCRPVQSHVWRERAVTLSALYGLRRPVAVVESPDRALLLTWGLMRPRIIVPAAAHAWTTDRIDVVLGHELAHIVRCDWTVQVAAEALRAVHWFNPLMWIACRQMRDESEHACDDWVLRRGVDASEYASHLLAVARHVLTAGGGWASAPAVVHVSTLERRIAAMLTVSRNREPVTRAAMIAALLVTLALAIPVAATTLTERFEETPFVSGQDITLTAASSIATAPVVETPVVRRAAPRVAAAAPVAAQQKPASLSGTIRDATGAVVPGVEMRLTNSASGMSEATNTDPSGRFVFRAVEPGQYQFTARLPGFRTLTEVMTLAAGQELRSDLMLQVGAVTETVTVTCRPVGAALLRGETGLALSLAGRSTASRLFPSLGDARGARLALAAQVVPVRVGGQIMAPRQVKKVPPRCPDVTPGAGLIVILEGTIGVDGLVKDLAVLRPRPADDKQTGYVQAATDAVRQWEYTPTRLNNVPTPVIMAVTVTFTVPAANQN